MSIDFWNPKAFINGKWIEDGEQKRIEVIDPASEAVVGTVPEATLEVTRQAISAARTAFDEGPWPRMKPARRAQYLNAFADELENLQKEIRDALIAEAGAVDWYLDGFQGIGAVGLVRKSATIIEHAFPWVENVLAPNGGATGVGGHALFREPIGVVSAITPFNFPFYLNLQKSAPAMAAGCTVVLKPHPWTPLTGFLMARAAEQADLPPGVFNVIVGGAEVGDEMTSNAMVDMVTFTGSTATGRRILGSAAETIKKVGLELGGKSAMIVLDDTDPEDVRKIGFGAVLFHCGQGCALPTRLLLPESLLDAYLEGIEAARETVKIGDPRDATSTLGPLVSATQLERVESYVASGIEQGARLITGGKRPEGLDKGYYYEPTVLIGDNSMRIAQEEIFGPVLTVIPYSGKDEDAIALANDSIYGLAGMVLSPNSGRAFNVARQVRAGSLTVSNPKNGFLAPADESGQGPGWGTTAGGVGQDGAFGGYKQSGLGREQGRFGIEEFTEVKSISWG